MKHLPTLDTIIKKLQKIQKDNPGVKLDVVTRDDNHRDEAYVKCVTGVKPYLVDGSVQILVSE